MLSCWIVITCIYASGSKPSYDVVILKYVCSFIHLYKYWNIRMTIKPTYFLSVRLAEMHKKSESKICQSLIVSAQNGKSIRDRSLNVDKCSKMFKFWFDDAVCVDVTTSFAKSQKSRPQPNRTPNMKRRWNSVHKTYCLYIYGTLTKYTLTHSICSFSSI